MSGDIDKFHDRLDCVHDSAIRLLLGELLQERGDVLSDGFLWLAQQDKCPCHQFGQMGFWWTTASLAGYHCCLPEQIYAQVYRDNWHRSMKRDDWLSLGFYTRREAEEAVAKEFVKL